MGLFRHARGKGSFHLMTCNGPVVFRLKSGRAGIEIDATKAVKIKFRKHDERLTSPPRNK